MRYSNNIHNITSLLWHHISRQLNGYLTDLADLTQRWPEFLTNTCPGLPPLESFPKPKVDSQHQSSKDPWGTCKASTEVWAEGGPIARALCLLSAPDYACFEDLPEGIPEFCQTVYKDHAQTLIDYGQKHYIDLAKFDSQVEHDGGSGPKRTIV